MPLSKAHKERSRQRVLEAATDLFARLGYEGAGINAIMEAAELTRGAFYAHFESKAALFTVVVGRVPTLLERLRARGDRHTHHVVEGAVEVIRDYLAIEDPPKPCGLESLATDVARSGIEARLSYAQRLGEVADELMRGFESDRPTADPRALAVIALAVGGRSMARASDPDPISEDLLDACASLSEAILRGDVEWPPAD